MSLRINEFEGPLGKFALNRQLDSVKLAKSSKGKKKGRSKLACGGGSPSLDFDKRRHRREREEREGNRNAMGEENTDLYMEGYHRKSRGRGSQGKGSG